MIKKKDLVVVSYLRKNGRDTLTQISRKTKIPISTVFDKLKGNGDGLIKKHTCLIDFAKLGFNARANIAIAVEKVDRDTLQEYLLKNFQVNSVYRINNGFDFLVEGIFKHVKGLQDFLENIDEKFKVKNKQIYYIIEDIKREEFLADPGMVDLVVD